MLFGNECTGPEPPAPKTGKRLARTGELCYLDITYVAFYCFTEASVGYDADDDYRICGNHFLALTGHQRGHEIVSFASEKGHIVSVIRAAGSHLFPSRTQSLSPLAPMILRCMSGGK